MMAAQQQQQGHLGAFTSIQQQQQAASLYGLQQQQQFRDLQQASQALKTASRKRKLPSVALCIKDGRVYSKPFSTLPPSIIGNNNKSVKTDAVASVASLPPQQIYQTSVNHQFGQYQSGISPYKPVQSDALGRKLPQVNPYQPAETAMSSAYQRLEQKLPVVSNEDSVSVEDYRSEEDPDIMDGEEVNDDESYRTDDDDDDIRSCDDDSQSKDDFPRNNHGQEMRPSNKIEINQISAESDSSEDEDNYAQAVPSSNEASNDVEEAFDDNFEKPASEVVNAPNDETPESSKPEEVDLPDIVQSASDILPGKLKPSERMTNVHWPFIVDAEPQPEEVNQESGVPAPTEMAQEEEFTFEESQEGVSL